ncbi:hypothetical protein [Myxococcus qinghaiensis]|uniref:hypothetical protein n=1 Tax=Myxococcus qinghaiensis TaxID=2906758 RepID=UPI0020A71673|nr:hypothetical protein [Myxococcus qinghaiensis]
MLLLKTIAVLALLSSTPAATAARPASSSGCMTTNIETALRHLFERYPDGGPLRIGSDSGDPLPPDFIAKSLKVRDVPNGYATFESPDAIASFEAALFKNPTGYHLVIVASGGSVNDFTVFRCTLEGLTTDPSALKISTEDAIRLYADAGLLTADGKEGTDRKTLEDWAGTIVTLSLPRKGRSIVIKADIEEPPSIYGKKLGTVDYVDSRFIVKSLKSKVAP